MRDYYFSIVGGFLVVLTLIGFSDNLFTDVAQPSNFDPKFVVHGIFCLAWMVLFAIQTNLIRSYNLKVHKTLGIATIFVAAGVVASTLYIYVVIWNGLDELAASSRTNRVFLLGFAVLVGLGYLYRRVPEFHKRFMYLATLLMLDPILIRIGPPYLPTELIREALFISFFVYDWKTLERIHPVTYLGFIWFCLVWAIAVLSRMVWPGLKS